MDSCKVVMLQAHMGQKGQTMTDKIYLEDFHAGLVDGAHYSAAGLHCVLHRLHDNGCSACIQTCSALSVMHTCVGSMSHIVSHVNVVLYVIYYVHVIVHPNLHCTVCHAYMYCLHAIYCVICHVLCCTSYILSMSYVIYCALHVMYAYVKGITHLH